jgi:hypothetical protein
MSIQIVDFDAALIESVDEAIRMLFSEQVVDALHSNLEDRRTISWDQIPKQLPTLSLVLEKYFGLGAHTVEREIAHRLYSRINLELPSDESYELTDYVKNARDKLRNLKPVAPSLKPPTMNLPLSGDFDRLFLESVRETIEEALGRDQAKVAFRFLERDVPFDKLQHHMPTFYLALKKNFGKDSGKIETAIARKLYQKLSLEFIETPNTELVRYVELAVVKLSQREQLGFVDSLGKP